MASKIAVLEYGKLIEEGDHRQLMAKRGRYYELFSTQAKRYVTEGEAVLEEIPEDIRPRHGMPHGGHAPDGRPPHEGRPHGDRPHGGHPPMGAAPDIGAGRRRDS